MAYYPLNECNGEVAYNRAPATKGTLNGTITGATLKQDGKVGKACSFDGVDDFITIADNSSLDFGTGDFSIIAMIKPTDSGTVQTIACKIDTGHNTASISGAVGWDLLVRTDQAGNYVSLRLNDSTGSLSCTPSSGGDVTNGAWHIVVVTLDRDSATGANIWKDGIKIKTSDFSARQGTLSNNGPMNLGARRDTTTDFFVGSKQHLALINRVLTDQEITKLTKIAGLAQ